MASSLATRATVDDECWDDCRRGRAQTDESVKPRLNARSSSQPMVRELSQFPIVVFLLIKVSTTMEEEGREAAWMIAGH